jgi:hypothetical protein
MSAKGGMKDARKQLYASLRHGLQFFFDLVDQFLQFRKRQFALRVGR